MRTGIKSWRSSISGQSGLFALELHTLERRNTYNGENAVDTITTLFLIGSSSNFLVTRSCVKSQTSSNYGHICPFTLELPALGVIFFGLVRKKVFLGMLALK